MEWDEPPQEEDEDSENEGYPADYDSSMFDDESSAESSSGEYSQGGDSDQELDPEEHDGANFINEFKRRRSAALRPALSHRPAPPCNFRYTF